MFKKWDIIVIVFLIVLSFIPELIFGVALGKNYSGTYAEITIEGKLYKTVALSEHRGQDEINIKTKYGYNIVKIKDQSIAIIDADCKDKICIKEGYVSKPGQSLVCLPHKVMVQIKGKSSKDYKDDIIPAS